MLTFAPDYFAHELAEYTDTELKEVNGSKQNAPPLSENALGARENAEKHIAKSSALDAIGQYDVTSPGSPSDEDTQNDGPRAI